MSMQQYYGKNGSYLSEHKKYFSEERTMSEVDFLIKALNLQKRDRIIDMACGHGRHTIELARRGFKVAGVDQSEYLISLCRSQSVEEKIDAKFYVQTIIDLNLPHKYDKAFLFFSEFGQFDPIGTLKSIHGIMEKSGDLLIDTDFFLRVVNHLKEKKDVRYRFDFTTMTLFDKESGESVRYYTFPEADALLANSGFTPLKFYGGYSFEMPSFDSTRMIIVSRKE